MLASACDDEWLRLRAVVSMRWGAPAVALLSALGASHARAQPLPSGGSAFEFLADYDAANATNRGSLQVILRATAIGFDAANFTLKWHNAAPLYCVTPTVDSAQALYFLRFELSLDPAEGKLPWSLALLAGLIRAYPCPPP
jgi:hypothetical protein